MGNATKRLLAGRCRAAFECKRLTHKLPEATGGNLGSVGRRRTFLRHTARTDTRSPDLNGVEGEFAGWRTWSDDTFEMHSGPFWHRREPDGTIRCAFRVQKKHLNSSSNVHGGCFMTFADYCLFAIAAPVLQGSVVTVDFACQFLDAGREGELILGTGESPVLVAP